MAHSGPNLLAATGGLLLASSRLARYQSREEYRDNLDAQSIRKNPNDLPGSFAGVLLDRKRAAGNGVGTAHVGAALARGRRGDAPPAELPQTPCAITPRSWPFVRAGFGANSKSAPGNCLADLSTARVSAARGAKNSAASIAKDSGVAGHCPG
jgi:hypothetical protein